MNPRILRALIAFIIPLVTEFGCSWPYYVNRRSELKNPHETGEIKVLMKDGTMYILSDYVVLDSEIVGQGVVQEDPSFVSFNGRLRISDIAYIQAWKGNFGKTLVATGAVAVVVLAAAASASQTSAIVEHKSVHAPVGSCPYIYSYDGAQYWRESETFAGAIFRAAERNNFDALRHLKQVDGELKLMLRNGGMETDYVDDVTLLAVNGPLNSEIIPDSHGQIHTVSNPQEPISCLDGGGRDVLSNVVAEDSTYWESEIDKRDVSNPAGWWDELTLKFRKPVGATKFKIIVVGGTTGLGDLALEQLFELAGPNQLRWYQRMDSLPASQNGISEFISKMGVLKVSVRENGSWTEESGLPNVGAGVVKEQVAVAEIPDAADSVLEIRLSCIADSWKIDRVYADFSPDYPVRVDTVSLLSATDEKGLDVAELLRRRDENYYVTTDGEYASLVYKDVPEIPGMKRSYVVRSTGFYYRWNKEGPRDLTALFLTFPGMRTALGSRIMTIWKEHKQGELKGNTGGPGH